MITLEHYFGAKILNAECTELMKAHATELLGRVNALLDEARDAGVYKDWIDVDTGTNISGTKGGSGDGGFRLSTSTTGAKGSQHRKARAVDVYDPINALDGWIGFEGWVDDIILTRHGLYREAPTSTDGWIHLQSVAPGSWRRTFNP